MSIESSFGKKPAAPETRSREKPHTKNIDHLDPDHQLQVYENRMQEEADDLTENFFRTKLQNEGITEQAAAQRAIADFCAKLAKDGVEPNLIGGRAMHAYARFLENTAGAKKNLAETTDKLQRMETVIGGIIKTSALGLGQDTVTRGGLTKDMKNVVQHSSQTPEQNLSFNKVAGAGQTEAEPAMFSLADMMKADQDKKPNSRRSPN